MDPTHDGFETFWPEYVRSHSNKLNRTLHVIGISLALACVRDRRAEPDARGVEALSACRCAVPPDLLGMAR